MFQLLPWTVPRNRQKFLFIQPYLDKVRKRHLVFFCVVFFIHKSLIIYFPSLQVDRVLFYIVVCIYSKCYGSSSFLDWNNKPVLSCSNYNGFIYIVILTVAIMMYRLQRYGVPITDLRRLEHAVIHIHSYTKWPINSYTEWPFFNAIYSYTKWPINSYIRWPLNSCTKWPIFNAINSYNKWPINFYTEWPTNSYTKRPITLYKKVQAIHIKSNQLSLQLIYIQID